MDLYPNRFKYLFLFFVCIPVFCYSQQNRYTFTFTESPLVDVIKEITKQSGVNILYNPVIVPDNIRITGTFKSYTLNQALDTFFRQTLIGYKLYKKDIVLYKKHEEIKETHVYAKPDVLKSNPARPHEVVIDTVTYSVITYDTIRTTLTDVIKIKQIDTIRVFDTIQVFQKVYQNVKMYRPMVKSYGIGINMSQGLFSSTLRFNNSAKDSTGTIKASLKEKNSQAFGLNFMYRNKSWLIETGINFTKLKYTFDYTTMVNEIVIRTDTIDKYYTDIVAGDTVWVYVTEEKQVETSSRKNFLSDLSYQYLSIPLLLGYTMVNRNFTFEFKGGLVCNYYLGSKGSYLTILPDNTFQVNQTKAPGSAFIFDVFGAVCIDYYLNEKVHIFTQPFVSYSSFTLGNSSTSYYQSYFQAGLQLGFRYFFKI